MLPINIEDLLYLQGIESSRVEFKASWSEPTGYQVLKTICAFANDLHNLNGGYIIIGVAEKDAQAVLPPKGLDPSMIDGIQKWIRGKCNRIDPPYQPIMSPEKVQDRHILVVWAPGSDTRPHRAPDGPRKGSYKYFVRLGSETVDAQANGVLQDLLHMTASVPFDDRRAINARVEELRESKVREFLHEVRSSLIDEKNTRELYRKMRIAAPVNDHDVPLNIGLMMFSDEPEHWFPCARIEVVQFSDDTSGNVIEERIFRGGLHEQVRACLQYLENLSHWHLEKEDRHARVKGWVSYPIQALREAVVNAVYHRSYENQYEPVKVYLYSDRMEIISYPGPVHGLEPRHFRPDLPLPPVPARNRRIGEILKELRLAEGRGTGLPKLFKAMRDNGSPEPSFDFDPERTYFRAILPAHPEYLAISALRNAGHLLALGDRQGAVERLEEAWRSNPVSATLASELIRLYGETGKLSQAKELYREFQDKAPLSFVPHVSNIMMNVLFEAGRTEEARKMLDDLPAVMSAADASDAAILARRLGRQEAAHKYFERAGDALLGDPRALHEFAQTKIKLAQKALYGGRGKFRRDTNRKLLQEARELLERVLQLEADNARHAWAWRDLARVKKWLKAPKSEVTDAYKKAVSLMPEETIFAKELKHWENNQKR